MEDSSNKEDFQVFLKDNGINEDTGKLLELNGFGSKQALYVMDIADISTLKVKPLGQRRLLENLLEKIKQDQGKTSSTQTSNEQGSTGTPTQDDVAGTSEMTGATRLDQTCGTTLGLQSSIGQTSGNGTPVQSIVAGILNTSQASGSTSNATGGLPDTITSTDFRPGTSTNTQGNINDCLDNLGIPNDHNHIYKLRGDLNPLVYLADNKFNNYLDITDFVPSFISETNEEVLSSSQSSELIVKSVSRKPKLESVSPLQWTAANSRILARLLLEGKICQSNIAHYLSYTVKVSTLALRYTWHSVLFYDREYRRLQASYSFPWGSDVQHLMSIHLVPRLEGQKHVRADFVRSTQKRDSVIRQKCKLFNHSTCVYGQNCKFLHVCNICNGSHSQSEHGK